MRTRRSPSCSSRRSSWLRPAPFWPHGAGGRRAIPRSGLRISPSSKATPLGIRSIETDRARFLGRGRGIRNPIAMAGGASLSNSVGAVLDPIFSLRRRIRVPPRTTVHVAFWTLIAASRDEVLDLVDKHHGTMAFDRATTLAWTQAQVELRHLGIGASEANVFQSLASRVLYADPSLRPASEVTQTRRRRGVAALGPWDLRRPADHPAPPGRNQRSGNRQRTAPRP